MQLCRRAVLCASICAVLCLQLDEALVLSSGLHLQLAARAALTLWAQQVYSWKQL